MDEPRGKVDLAEGSGQPRLGYRPDIDGLRALAVVGVIVHHFSRDVLPSGFLGVDIFFVISGYVISASLGTHRELQLGPFLRDFYVRRVKRLMPALIACVLITGMAILVVDPAPLESLRTGATALLGASNISLALEDIDYFSRAIELNVFAQTWSLGVEEQFYLLFPLLFWAGLRFGRMPLYVAGLAALALLSLVAFVLGTNASPRVSYYIMPTRFWELAAGALLFAFVRSGRARALPAPAAPLFLVTALALLAAPREFQVAATIGVVIATVGLIGAIRPGTRSHAVLAHPVVTYLGRISYSLYLWHWSVLSISRLTVGISAWTIPFQLLAIVAISVLSYEFIERPLRRSSWAGRRWRTVGLGLAASLACVVALYGLLGIRDASGFRTLVASVSTPPAFLPLIGSGLSFGPACVVTSKTSASAAATVDACTVSPKIPSGQTIWVLGDSHAGHLQGMLYALHEQTGIGVHVVETPGVAFPMIPEKISEPRQRLAEEILPRLRTGDIMAVSRLMLEREGGHAPYPDVQVWSEVLVELAQQMAVRGVNVVVFGPPPMFEFDLVSNCLLFISASSCDVDRSALAEQVGSVLGLLRDAAETQGNLFVFDSFGQLCPADAARCSPTRDGVALFRDADHLNSHGAAVLAGPFLDFLEANRLLK